jgi:hypothetical protein
MLVGLPLLGGFGIFFGLMLQKGMKQSMKAYSQSAGYAE